MTEDALPSFRYYADPVGEGVFVRSDATCDACGRARGWLADCVLYSAEVDGPAICPWCVADGTAARKWDGTFNEVFEAIATARSQEVCERTPGITTWQDWDWPCHCDDAMRYLGRPGEAELRARPAALENLLVNLRQYAWGTDEEQVAGFLGGLGGSVVAYHFGSLHCGADTVVWDSD